MNKELITVVVRAGVQVVAGLLLHRGFTVADSELEVIVGSIATLVSVVWSAKEKAKIKSETVHIAKP